MSTAIIPTVMNAQNIKIEFTETKPQPVTIYHEAEQFEFPFVAQVEDPACE
jgi:hypothetical protein